MKGGRNRIANIAVAWALLVVYEGVWAQTSGNSIWKDMEARRTELCSKMPSCSEPWVILETERHLATLCTAERGVAVVAKWMDHGKETERKRVQVEAERHLRTAKLLAPRSRSVLVVGYNEDGNGKIRLDLKRPARFDFTMSWQRAEYWKLHEHLEKDKDSIAESSEEIKNRQRYWGWPMGKFSSSVPVTVWSTDSGKIGLRYGREASWTEVFSEFTRLFKLVQEHPDCIKIAEAVRRFDQSGESERPVASITRFREKNQEYNDMTEQEVAWAFLRKAGGAVVQGLEHCGTGWPNAEIARCRGEIGKEPWRARWEAPEESDSTMPPEETLGRLRELVPTLATWSDEDITLAFAERFVDFIMTTLEQCGSGWPKKPCNKNGTEPAATAEDRQATNEELGTKDDILKRADTNENGRITCSEARSAGLTLPVTSDHSAYQYMHDKDGDGKVCG